MSRLSRLPTSQSVSDHVSIAFTPISVGDTIAKALSGFSAKAIAARLRRFTAVSSRTVEAWKARRRMPSAPQIMALMSDNELCALLLAEVNPAVARQAAIIEAEKKLKELREAA